MSSSTITPWVVGNWKMNPVQADAMALVKGICDQFAQQPIAEARCVVGVAPISIALTHVQNALQQANRPIYTVAQDLSRIAGTGAYTGEISAELLADSQIHYVLVGHSERREIFAEDKTILNAKIKNALNAGLTVIYCVGESLAQREAGHAEAVVLQQICDIAAVVDAEQWANIVIAYEPIWAIGTGKSASVEIAEDCCKTVRETVRELFGDDAAEKVRIQYGGSVKPGNIVEYMAQPDIDGALIGGASLKEDSFIEIIEKTK